MSFLIVRYVLMAAIRDRMLWGVIAVSILAVCLSFFSGSAAVIEQDQFVTAYLAGGLRLLTLIALTLFVVFFVRRSFDSRDVEFLLTRPISRTGFVVSHSLGFSLLAVFTGVLLGAIIGAVNFTSTHSEAVILWSLGVTFEYIIVAQVAFFFSMVLSSPVSAGLSTLGFYILSRLMGSLLAIANSPNSLEIMGWMAKLLGAISVFIPRFDLMAETSWLIYGDVALKDWAFVLAQGGIFICLVVVAIIFDLRRRQF